MERGWLRVEKIETDCKCTNRDVAPFKTFSCYILRCFDKISGDTHTRPGENCIACVTIHCYRYSTNSNVVLGPV